MPMVLVKRNEQTPNGIGGEGRSALADKGLKPLALNHLAMLKIAALTSVVEVVGTRGLNPLPIRLLDQIRLIKLIRIQHKFPIKRRR